jgi:hypothetical protein
MPDGAASGRGRAPAKHAPTFHVQHLLAVVVEHFPVGAHQAHIGAAAHGARFEDAVLQAQRVARVDGLHPLHVLQSGRAQAGGGLQKIRHHQPHCHGTGVPAAGAKATKHRGLGGFVVQVKGLRVKLAGKSKDLFARHREAAQIQHLTRLQVFPKNGDFSHQRPPDTSRKLMVV